MLKRNNFFFLINRFIIRVAFIMSLKSFFRFIFVEFVQILTADFNRLRCRSDKDFLITLRLL